VLFFPGVVSGKAGYWLLVSEVLGA
jgi:hypothetical protein